MTSDKITPEHLARDAVVYIRQSSPHQVTNNVESKRRQYQLVERGRQLGWSDVKVIDDDLGRSADGIIRPGFERLLARICEGSVGMVLSIEASRLARTGREWHTLLEFCGVVNCLLADENRIYDPREPDDRLVLGMKGTMSEMELSILRQRAGEAKKQKARRGELLGIVAIGYVRTDDDRVEKDPNRRVQDAIDLVFNKFAELQTARQVLIWMKQEQVLRQTIGRVENAKIPRDLSYFDEPNLRRGIRVRSAGNGREDRERAQADHPPHAPQLDRVGRFDQGTP